MPQSTNGLHSFKIHARDGEIGTLEDLYFDDGQWIVRYLVVDTGKWLPGRRVLIAPASVQTVDWSARTIQVNLTRDQVRNSPDAGADKPVSRQHEEELSAYYGWPSYWMSGSLDFEPMVFPPPPPPPEDLPAHQGNPHLRSAHAVKATTSKLSTARPVTFRTSCSTRPPGKS